MTLRVSLVLAIVAALGAALVSQLILRPQIRQIIGQRDAYARERYQQASLLQGALADLQVAATEREHARRRADESDRQHAAALSDLLRQRQSGVRLEENLAHARAEKLEVERTLARWQALSLTPEQVVRIREGWMGLQKENEALAARNRDLAVEVKRWSGLVTPLVPLDDPLMPADLEGHVTAVDSKWGFVVLDVGGSNGVQPGGILLVSRNGRLVAQARVTRVEPGRSIAEIVSGTQLSAAFEGDSVIPRALVVAHAAIPRS